MNKNCKEGHHTFERDELNKNRFVCTHCGLEKDISVRANNSSNTTLVFAFVIAIVWLLTVVNQQPEFQVKPQVVEQPNKILNNVN